MESSTILSLMAAPIYARRAIELVYASPEDYDGRLRTPEEAAELAIREAKLIWSTTLNDKVFI